MRIKLWTLALVTALAAGCTTLQDSLKQVRAGMDKGEVLQILGNPKFTFRENSQDHWAYFYEQGGQEWRRDVVFENGRVIRVTKPLTKEKWQKELEGSNNIEEFEAIARERARKSSKFQDIGRPDDGEKAP